MGRFIQRMVFLFCLLFAAGGYAQEWRQVSGGLHVQTRFDGSGRYSLDQLVTMARNRGLGILIPSDHDYQVMEYGVPPFRRLLKKRETRDSVIGIGPEKFLAEIERVNAGQRDVLVIPAVQSSPFYYWSGIPFREDFTANDYRKEHLVVGLSRPGDYRHLPVLHGPFSTRYTLRLLPRTLVFLAAFVLSAWFITRRGSMRYLGMGLAVVSLGSAVNHHPFQSSLFDPYHGDRGVAPHQELIDYVNEKGGLTFWLHPESNFGLQGERHGPVRFRTPHYVDDLVNTFGYAGFEALYGDTITMTAPGRQWDAILGQYCRGERDRPVWGFAGVDFHGDRPGETIDEFQTVFLLKEKTQDAVLDALRSGRHYAVRKGKGGRLVLETFAVADEDARDAAISGETLAARGHPVVRGRLSDSRGDKYHVSVRLIRSGKVFQKMDGALPMAFEIRDEQPRTATIYYRLEAAARGRGELLSNPIFVQRP